MSSIAFWIGVIVFGLGAIFGLLSALRTLQISRRWSDYRLRQRYMVQARGSVLLALLSGGLALALLVLARSTSPGVATAPAPEIPTNTAQATPSPTVQEPPTGTTAATALTPTETPITPSPVVIPTTAQATATPVMPIAVQALIQGTVTPAFDVEFGRLRFSTEINDYTLVAPGEQFTNPIKQMYSVFTYQPVGVKVEWIALWYENSELKYVDTTSWKDFPAGVGVASWIRPAPEWQPGNYEVQIFLGTDWKASGRFALEGNPPTVTPSPPPSSTFTAVPTSTASGTSTVTRTPASTQTATPKPSATASPSALPTNTAAARAAASATPPASQTPAPSATWTVTPSTTTRPSATAIPSSTATRAPSLTPSVTTTPTLTPTLMPVTLDVYFTNPRPSSGAAPAPEAVTRRIAGTNDLIAAALDQYFAGPTVQEQNNGLELTLNGFAGYRRVEVANGVVSVYLAGNCVPSGAGYSLAQPLIATLRQFPSVLYVKLYDGYDHTANALSAADSWPTCLDVIFTLTPTGSPTPRPTRTPSITPRPSATSTRLPTLTPRPTSTPSPQPSRTPLPTATRTPAPSATSRPLPTATATRTPLPSATSTRTPSRTPTIPATATRTRTPPPSFTARPTLTASVTSTPGPTWTPRPTLTLTPINAPTKALSSTAQATVFTGPTPTLDAACNHAEFLGDVTIVDNATLRPGEAFRKTWRIQNAGNCPWTSAYRLVFVRGDRMGAADSVPLPALVAPGQTADVSVDLTAPVAPGEYGGFWQLQTPGGTSFGMGPTASGNLWVQIRVAGEPVASAVVSTTSAAPSITPTGWAEATLTAFVATQTAEAAPTATARAVMNTVEIADLAETACSAQWQANDGILGCPGTEGDTRGLVTILNQADLEDGSRLSAPTLLTVPSDAQDGYILGLYPQYQVRPGDRFTTGVGCEIGAQLCSVLFRVSYLDTMGAAHDLWTVGEFQDGHHVDADIDLSGLAGQQIRIVLSVGNLGSSEGDRALWIAPRIVNAGGGDAITQATIRPTNTVRPTLTQAASPTPPAPPPSPTVTAPTATPTAKPPIPQFFDVIAEFFRQLLGQR